jgi:hypothetical protein
MFSSARLGCSICGNGLVAFVVAADGQRLVLFCLQCGTWYVSVEHNANCELADSTAAEGPDLHLVGCDCYVKWPPARWATAQEVRAYGWGDYLNPEPNHWAPDQVWSEAEWSARMRGVDVWEWDALLKQQLQKQETPQAEQPRAQLLDQYGRPFAKPDAGPDPAGI